jgi:hypothetical protein
LVVLDSYIAQVRIGCNAVVDGGKKHLRPQLKQARQHDHHLVPPIAARGGILNAATCATHIRSHLSLHRDLIIASSRRFGYDMLPTSCSGTKDVVGGCSNVVLIYP